MPIQSIVPLLPANDVAQAIAWYTENLGFRKLFAYREQEPHYGAVVRDSAEIHLFRMDINPLKSDWMVYLRVTSIEILYQEFKARKLIHPNGPLRRKEWGQNEFAVIDLNGALLRFGEPAAPES